MEEIRMFLHLFAASIWLGGQVVMGSLVPTLRAAGPEVPSKAAQAFNRVAWPAFFIVVVTGIWNLFEADEINHPAFEIKFLLVVISGAGAAAHVFARGNKAMWM
jgi:putative copper export protein